MDLHGLCGWQHVAANVPELTSTMRNRTPHRLHKRFGWICAAACFSLISQAAAQPLSVPDPQVGGDLGQLPRFELFDEGCFLGATPDETDPCGFVVVSLARAAEGRASTVFGLQMEAGEE